MLMEHTLQILKALRLLGMATAFEEQQRIAASAELSFDERFSMLVDREQSWRDNRRVTRLLHILEQREHLFWANVNSDSDAM
jgi:hypothetical protein